MAPTRSQSQLDQNNNVAGSSAPSNPAVERVTRAESSNERIVAEQGQAGEINIPKNLTEDQRRQLEANPVTLATMRIIMEEQHSNLANLVTRCVANTIRPLIINTVQEITGKQSPLMSFTQPQTAPVALLGGVGSLRQPSATFPDMRVMRQGIPLMPVRILQRGENALANQAYDQVVTNEGNMVNLSSRNENTNIYQLVAYGTNLSGPIQTNATDANLMPQHIALYQPLDNMLSGGFVD